MSMLPVSMTKELMDFREKLEELRRKAEAVFAASRENYPGVELEKFDEFEVGAVACIGGEAFFRMNAGLGRMIPEAAELIGEYREVLSSPFFPEESQLAPLRKLKSIRADGVLYLDIETTGLGVSSPLFLIGLMYAQGEDLAVDQLLARDYSEERAVLLFLASMFPRFSALVTFNGSSFDLPCIENRMTVHKLSFSPPRIHLDLLPISKAYLGRRTPDHRLQTLEFWLCGRKRIGDIPGSEIPATYHEYVRTGDWRQIAGILRHNRMDLLTMIELVTLYLSGEHRKDG